MNNIHSSVIIGENVTIGSNVIIEPFCIIEDNVVIGSNNFIGQGSKIKSFTQIGNGNKIHENVMIGGLGQDLNFDEKKRSGVIIGDNNTFREIVVIHRGTVENKNTKIGNNNYLMSGVHVAHDVILKDNIIIASNSVLGGFTEIDNNAFLSGLVAVHQNCRIGSYAIVGGVCKVTKDIPPYSMVDRIPCRFYGINKIGIKRANFSLKDRKYIENFYKEFYENSFNKSIENLQAIKDKTKIEHVLYNFLNSTKRGIVNCVSKS